MNITALVLSKYFYGGERWTYIRLKKLSEDPNIFIQVITQKSNKNNFSSILNAKIVTIPSFSGGSIIKKSIFYVYYQFFILYHTLKFRTNYLLVSLEKGIISSALTLFLTRTRSIWFYVAHVNHLYLWGFPAIENNIPYLSTSQKIASKVKNLLVSRITLIYISDILNHKFLKKYMNKGSKKFFLAYSFPEEILPLNFEEKERKTIIFPHRLIKWKGCELLVKMIPIIINYDSEIKFFILGNEDEYYNDFYALSLKYPQQVKTLGYINDPMPLYKKSEVCLQLTEISNPQNNVVLDSFNTGIVLILKKSKLIDDDWFKANGKDTEVLYIEGTVKEMAEKITKLMNNPERIRQIAKNGHNLLKRRHNSDLSIEKLTKFLMRNY